MAIIKKLSAKRRQKRVAERRINANGSFAVRDLRDREWFTVDNAYLDDKWLRLLKGCPSAVYFAICRHSDKEQIAFPSVPYLMDETGYGKRQVTRAIKALEFHRLLRVERERGDHNLYTLINRKHWRKVVLKKKKQKDTGDPWMKSGDWDVPPMEGL